MVQRGQVTVQTWGMLEDYMPEEVITEVDKVRNCSQKIGCDSTESEAAGRKGRTDRILFAFAARYCSLLLLLPTLQKFPALPVVHPVLSTWQDVQGI